MHKQKRIKEELFFVLTLGGVKGGESQYPLRSTSSSRSGMKIQLVGSGWPTLPT